MKKLGLGFERREHEKGKGLNGKVKVLPGQLKLRKEEKEMDFSKVGKATEGKAQSAPAPGLGVPWLKDCDICNAGLCKRMDELIAPVEMGGNGQGLSERKRPG